MCVCACMCVCMLACVYVLHIMCTYENVCTCVCIHVWVHRCFWEAGRRERERARREINCYTTNNAYFTSKACRCTTNTNNDLRINSLLVSHGEIDRRYFFAQRDNYYLCDRVIITLVPVYAVPLYEARGQTTSESRYVELPWFNALLSSISLN